MMTAIASQSSSFTMADRLVWFRHRDDDDDNNDGTDHDDDDDDTTNHVEWVPAIYYASHTEMQQQLQLQNKSLSSLISPLLRRTITMQFLQEQMTHQPIPLIQILVPLSSSSSCSNTKSHPMNDTLDLRIVDSENMKKERIQFDFFQHLITMNHATQSHSPATASRTLPLCSSQHIQTVYQLLQQEQQQQQQQQQQQESKSLSSSSSMELPSGTNTASTGRQTSITRTEHSVTNDIRRTEPEQQQQQCPSRIPERSTNTIMSHRVSLDGGNSPPPTFNTSSSTVSSTLQDENHTKKRHGCPDNEEGKGLVQDNVTSTVKDNHRDEETDHSIAENTDRDQDPNDPALVSIKADDTLAVIKQKLLQYGGWTYRCMNVYPKVIYYWVQPNRSVDTGRPNIDYYIDDAQLIQYLQSKYPHWRGNGAPKHRYTSTAPTTTTASAVTTTSSARRSLPEENDEEEGDDDEEKDEQEESSRVSRSRPLRRDRPRHHPVSSVNHPSPELPNSDQEEVEEEEADVPFPHTENEIESEDDDDEESENEESDNDEDPVLLTQESRKNKEVPSAKSKNNKATSKENNVKQSKQGGNTLKLKKQVPVKSVPKKKQQPYRSEMITPKRTKKTNWKNTPNRSKSSLHWWKFENIPSVKQIRPILQKIGFIYDETTHKYQFPSYLRHPSNKKEVLTMGYNGLRKFLCRYGIPPSSKPHGTTSKRSTSPTWCTNLSEKQQELLRRWIVFANVPTTSTSHPTTTKQELRNIGSPKKREQLITKLYTLGFSTVDGKLFVPEYKQMTDFRLNPKPIYEKHYFHLDTELYTKVRWYIRHSWHLGVVTMNNSKDDDDGTNSDRVLEKYYEDQERMKTNRKYYETLLFVRLWAAASSQPIPTFTSLPEHEYLEPYLYIPDINDNQEEDNDNDVDDNEEKEHADVDESSTQASDDSPDVSKSTVSSEAIEVDDDEEDQSEKGNSAALTSPETSVTSVESEYSSANYDDDPEWYLYQPLPDFGKSIWPILVKLRFHFRSGMYGHPDVPEPIGNSIDVRQFCVRYGIPNFDNDEALTEKERQLLFRWAAFAHVDVRQSNSMQMLRNVRQLNTTQIQKLLIALKFQMIDNKIFIPGADYMVGGRSDRKQGVHYFIGMEGIRGYIRGAPDLWETSTTRRRSSTPTIAHEDMLALRLWAALSKQPLPIYQTTKCEQSEANGKVNKDNIIIDVEGDEISTATSNNDQHIDPVSPTNESYECDLEIHDAAPLTDDVDKVGKDGQTWHTPCQGSSSLRSNLFTVAATQIDQPQLGCAIERNMMLPVSQTNTVDALMGTSSTDSTANPVEEDAATPEEVQDTDFDHVLIPVSIHSEKDAEAPLLALDVNDGGGQNCRTPSQESSLKTCTEAIATTDQPVLDEVNVCKNLLQVSHGEVSESLKTSSTSISGDIAKDDMIRVDTAAPDYLINSLKEESVKRDMDLSTARVVAPASKRLRRTSFEGSVLERACFESDDDDGDMAKTDHCKNHYLLTQDDNGNRYGHDDGDESKNGKSNYFGPTSNGVRFSSACKDWLTRDDTEDGEVMEECVEIPERRTSANQLHLFTQIDMDDEEEEGEVKDHRDTEATDADSTSMNLGDDNPTVSNYEVDDETEEWHFY